MELITAISQQHVLYLRYQHLWFLFLIITSMLESAVVGAVVLEGLDSCMNDWMDEWKEVTSGMHNIDTTALARVL